MSIPKLLFLLFKVYRILPGFFYQTV